MRSRRRRHPTLLGEAFALKESDGWAAVEDNIHIQQEIDRRRRKALIMVVLVITLLTVALVGVLKVAS